MQVTISFRDQIMARYANQMGALGAGQAQAALARALRHTGAKARTRVIRALTAQTGLKRATIARAVREVRGDAAALEFVLRTQGGNIRLKHFKARETRKGVSAAPWAKRQIYAGTFMRAGWWSTGRVDKPKWNRQVFARAGGVTRTGKDKFEVQRSGLYIPTEMLTGQTAQAFQDLISSDLIPRVGHELGRMLPGK
jgi:hypothetical protein